MTFYGSTPWISSVCTVLHAPCHFISRKHKYFQQHPVLKHPQPMFFPEYNFTPVGIIKQGRWNGQNTWNTWEIPQLLQSFGRKTRRTETIWETKARMEEQANVTKYDKMLSVCSATCFGYKCTTFTEHIMPGLEPMISCHLQVSEICSCSAAHVSGV